MKDKLYMIFGYDYYYPSGGMEDLIATDVKTLERAKEICKQSHRDWYEIVDKKDWSIVWADHLPHEKIPKGV